MSAPSRPRSRDLPCYSARLVAPFVELLAQQPGITADALAALRSFDADERIAVTRVHEMLSAALSFTGDPLLGLKAGRSMAIGQCGALDYAMRSSGTVGDAIAIAVRYAGLINDVLALQLELDGDQALLRFASRMVMPRAANEFMMSGFYATHARTWLGDLSQLECWLPYPAPADLDEYRRTFAPARLRFDMPCCAFVFDRAELVRPLPEADPELHAVIRKLAEAALAELPRTQSLTDRVRELAAQQLPNGVPTAALVARRLSLSQRTLTRKLAQEGTSFSQLFDELRKQLGLRYVASRQIPLAEVAFLLGFSDVTTFHRSFKRWTGRTPLEYRRACNGG
jgi:AraC-like DNA-binding protein